MWRRTDSNRINTKSRKSSRASIGSRITASSTAIISTTNKTWELIFIFSKLCRYGNVSAPFLYLISFYIWIYLISAGASYKQPITNSVRNFSRNDSLAKFLRAGLVTTGDAASGKFSYEKEIDCPLNWRQGLLHFQSDSVDCRCVCALRKEFWFFHY